MEKKSAKIIKFLLLDLALLTAISLFFAIPWGFKNYPIQLHWNVFFVLAADTSGADSGTGLSILFGFVIPTIIVFALYKSATLLFIKNRERLYKIHKILSLSLFCLAMLILIFTTKIWKYFKIAKIVLGKPVSSEFYKENFVSENDFKIIPPEKKRNLIYIFMESMESTFTVPEKGGVLTEDLLPNICNLANENVNFGDEQSEQKLGGAYNLYGTNWTVAGLLSKTSGVPYFSPFTYENENGNKKGKRHCLKNLKKLGDFLYEQDYNLVFSMGSKKQFENRDTVLEEQHFEVHDIEWYKENGFLDPNYEVFWGFEDAKLYDFARKELTELSKDKKPFAYGFLTVDTHFPDGYTCPLCKNENNENIENVFQCADRQLFNFIEWAKTQSWYENTTIVVTGDHSYLNAVLNNFIERNSSLSNSEIEQKRRVLDIFINPAETLQNFRKKRAFSSFDMLPTILEAMGNKIEGSGMYLGRSLFSSEPTLVEKYSEDYVNNEIMQKTVEYEALK